MDRRRFLAGLGAAPFVFGLDDLSAQADPAWKEAAFRRMKETRRHGVVLVLPPEAKREGWAEALRALIHSEREEVYELFSEAVFICMTAELAGAQGNRLLLDPDGKRIAADTVAWDLTAAGGFHDRHRFSEPDEVLKSLRLFLHGEGDARLKKSAAEIAVSLPVEVKPAVEKLEAESIEERGQARAALLKHADALMPWLVLMKQEAPAGERRSQLAEVIQAHFKSFQEDRPGSRLPYGCALVTERVDPCPPCGMAVVTDPSRNFLKRLQFMIK